MVSLKTFQKQFFNYWVVMNKLIMKSLSTREKPCVEELYLKCVARKVNEKAKNLFNCNLHPLLPHNTAKDTCPNQVVKSLLNIWTTAIASPDQFEDCLNIQPCSQVIYSTRTNTEKIKLNNSGKGQGSGNHSQPHKQPPNARGPVKKRWQTESESKIYLSFENNLVQVIEDQYVYSIMGIISEIGGALGILVGMSVMTIVEYFLMLQKKAALLRRHFQEASNTIQPVKMFNSNDENALKTITKEFLDDEQNKKSKTALKDTFKVNVSVGRRGSMIPNLSNNLGLFENIKN